MTRWEVIRKMNWPNEYAENGIINETDFNKEIDSLIKVYNDLAESHSKQVNEITHLKSVNEQWHKIFDPIFEWGKDSGVQIGKSVSEEVLRLAKDHNRLESELLKAKEQAKEFKYHLDNLINHDCGFHRINAERHLNKKP